MLNKKKHHNMIERKSYHKRIGKIKELKELLKLDNDENVTKYEILTKSINYIYFLIKEKEYYSKK
jgi:hypothetical protein